MVSRFRSIIKTVTFRVLATVITIILVLIFTGNLPVAFAVGGLETVSKLIVYYLHERLWDKIHWGREPM